jgi:integrase
MYSDKIALKCLAMIQARYEESLQGLCQFRIEEFLAKGYTDVLEYYEKWMADVVERHRKPATVALYWYFYRRFFKPFFSKHNIMLHEIKLDTLTSLMNSIDICPSGKRNAMSALRAMMDYAFRSERIQAIPPFPKKSEYGITEKAVKWLSSERQMRIINAIPEQHRPIFLWLKYHLRRPGEARALRWEDYDAINRVFIIRRTVSARKVVESTKTGVEHIIPCHPEFEGYM